MAKIIHSEAAPDEQIHYSFAAGEFDLGGRKKSFETDDQRLLSEAKAHPALDVVLDAQDQDLPEFHEQLRPEDDALSAINSVALVEEPPADEYRATVVVALDAGKPQTVVVEAGDVAETLAADPTSKTAKKKD